MLSDRERQVLAHLEADLCRKDPLLAVALLRMCPPQPGRWVRIVYATVVALALIVTLVCLALFADGTAGGAPARCLTHGHGQDCAGTPVPAPPE